MLQDDDGPVVRCALEWQDNEGEPVVPQHTSIHLSTHELGDDSLPLRAGVSATGLPLHGATADHLRSQPTDGRLMHWLHNKERLVFRFTEQGCEVAFQTNEVVVVPCSWPIPEDAVDDIDITHPLMVPDDSHTIGVGLDGLRVSTPEPEGSAEIAVPGAVWRVHRTVGLCSGMEQVE